MEKLLEFRSLAAELIEARAPKAPSKEVFTIQSILRTATERNAAKEVQQVQAPQGNVWDNAAQYQQTTNTWAMDSQYQEMAKAMGRSV